MVYRGPSVGCRACRARHVGCDNTKPACKNCTSRGKTCPGFEDVNGVVFKDATRQVYEKQARRAKRVAIDKEKKPAAIDREKTRTPRLPLKLQHVDPETASICFFFRRYVPSASRDPSPNRTFIEHILPRYQLASSSTALRSAVSVIASKALYFHRDRKQTSPWHVRNELAAVQALQKALIDPEECLQDDTLLAVLCFGLVDALEGPESARYRTRVHTDGALALVLRRGSHSFTSQTSRSLFAATRNNVLLQSLWYPHDSERRRLIMNLPNVEAPKCNPLAALHYILVRVLRLERALLEREPGSVSEKAYQKLAHIRAEQARRLRAELEDWSRDLPPGWEFPRSAQLTEVAAPTIFRCSYDLPEIVYVLAQWYCTSLIALKLAYAAINEANGGQEATGLSELDDILAKVQRLVDSLLFKIFPILDKFGRVEAGSKESALGGSPEANYDSYPHAFHLRHLYLPNILSWSLVTLVEPMAGAEGFGVHPDTLKYFLCLRQTIATRQSAAEQNESDGRD